MLIFANLVRNFHFYTSHDLCTCLLETANGIRITNIPFPWSGYLSRYSDWATGWMVRWSNTSLISVVEREGCAVKQCQPACSELKQVPLVVRFTILLVWVQRIEVGTRGLWVNDRKLRSVPLTLKATEFQLLTSMNGFSNCTSQKIQWLWYR